VTWKIFGINAAACVIEVYNCFSDLLLILRWMRKKFIFLSKLSV